MVLVQAQHSKPDQHSKTGSSETQSNSIPKYIGWFPDSKELVLLTRSFSFILTQPGRVGF